MDGSNQWGPRGGVNGVLPSLAGIRCDWRPRPPPDAAASSIDIIFSGRRAFDQHGEPAARPAEAEPGAAIGQRVGTHRLDVDRLPPRLDRAEAGGGPAAVGDDDLLAVLDLVGQFAQMRLGMRQADGQHASLMVTQMTNGVAVSLLNTQLL